MVHGGGFYAVENSRWRLAECRRNCTKYEAYFTWITGFLLLGLIYHAGAEQFLIDPTIYDLSPMAAIASA